MKFDPLCRRRFSVLLALVLLLGALGGCRSQVVEKVGVLPDRPTQFMAHNTENESTEPVGQSWNVQNVDELQLFSSDMVISEAPSAYYFDNAAYLRRMVPHDSDSKLYSLERIEADGTLVPIHSMTVADGSYCYYSPTGSTVAYETWIDGCLTLLLVDLATNNELVLWQSDEASILKELGVSARLICQWSPDGSTLMFLPICFDDGSSFIAETVQNDESTQAEITAEEAAASEASAPASGNSSSADSSEAAEPKMLSDGEKMQIVYDSLPNFPLIYTYQLQQKNLQSFLIAANDYPLYDGETLPMICANQDGSLFFIYFNSPWNSSLAHYVDLPNMLHYSTPLNSYLPSFTQLGSEPLFYENLLYLHIDDVGIMVFDPNQGTLMAQYPFNDPIHSFTIYDNALIVAQPSSIGGGVDVTAYMLNQETKQSVLLYHNNETNSPFINHMEMSSDGMHLLIEQLPSEYHTQKQLIQLSFS